MYGAKVVTVPAATAAGKGSVAALANTGVSVGWMLFGGVALIVSGLMLRIAVLRRPAKQQKV
jgi:hypothetical protein